MSVEVQSNSHAASPTSPSSMRAIDTLYNMFITDKPLAALPLPMIPSAPSAPAARAKPPSPAPTSCSMNGVTKTIIMIGGVNGKMNRLKTAMERSRHVADIATGNGNALHYVFLGGALPPHGAVDEKVVDQLVAYKAKNDLKLPPEQVHLIAGPREIQSLSMLASPDAPETSPLSQYLLSSQLVECIGRQDMDDKGSLGVWIKATSTMGGAMVGKLPGVGVVGASGLRAEWIDPANPLSPIAWKNELNKRWKIVVANARKLKEESPSKYQFWMTLGVQSALDDEKLPEQGFGTREGNSMAVFSRPLAPFGRVRRTLVIEAGSMAMLPGACWLDIGTTGDSLYWGVQTYCYSTMAAMNGHKLPTLDRTPSVAELQYDVSCTLGSLVRHSEKPDVLTPPTHPWANFGELRGQLGPCVCAGREGQEVMRVVYWTGPDMPSVIMLLPEAYVRTVLSDYYSDMLGALSMGTRAVSGFLVLHDRDVVQMRVPDVSEPEQDFASESMGARIWRVPDRPHAKGNEVLREMAGAPAAWRRVLQLKVKGVPESGELVPGKRVDTAPDRHIFYTHTTSADPLAGLMVKWVFAPGSDSRDMPTLDVANDEFQTLL